MLWAGAHWNGVQVNYDIIRASSAGFRHTVWISTYANHSDNDRQTGWEGGGGPRGVLLIFFVGYWVRERGLSRFGNLASLEIYGLLTDWWGWLVHFGINFSFIATSLMQTSSTVQINVDWSRHWGVLKQALLNRTSNTRYSRYFQDFLKGVSTGLVTECSFNGK